MRAKDVVAECAQALRGSSFEYEQLLGTSVERVWLGVAGAIERSLLAKRGLSVPGLGKFGFYKELPHALVFLLADRFLQSHSGVSWRNRPPPAPLAVMSDLNMAVLGGDVGLARDQTQQSLDELLRFIGRKLANGSASGKLAVGRVGSFVFDGKSLAFTFDTGFAKRVSDLQGRKDAPAALAALRSDQRRPKQKISGDAGSRGNGIKKLLERSASVDERVGGVLNGSVGLGTTPTSLGRENGMHARSAMEIGTSTLEREGDKASGSGSLESTALPSSEATSTQSKSTTKKRHHHCKHNPEPALARPSSADKAADASTRSDPVPRILPRFLIPEPSVPLKASNSRHSHDLVMQAAFEREKARLAEAKLANERQRRDLESRQRATQLEMLQQRAETIVGQRSLNAFLNHQIGDKRERRRRRSKAIEAAVDPESVTILPRDRALSVDAKREQKQKLNKRLNDQVAASAALKRDRRVVDQAEMAYFISQLDAQALEETEAKLAHKRASKQELLANWTQQVQLRALQKELQLSR